MPVKPVYDSTRLFDMSVEQFGLMSRGQALECGVNRSALAYLIRDGGPWQRLLPGVYATTTGTVTPDQRAMGALLHAGPRGLITGAAAVRRHDLSCAGLNEVDVLVPAGMRVHSVAFVRIIRTTRMPETHYSTRQIKFASAPRAVADAARGMSRLSDVRAVVAEAIQRGRCDLASLVEELNEGPSAGSGKFRRALSEVGDGIRSPAEADLKELIDGSHLEKPMYNPRLYGADGTFLGVPDAWWQRAGVAAEVDSRQYHLNPADHEKTAIRHNRIAAHGVNMLHFQPATLRSRPSAVLRDLRGAIESGNRRPPLGISAIPALA